MGHIVEIAWYPNSRCLLIASSTGLWLYDINQPNIPLLFTNPESSEAIRGIAINPIDSSFAFSVEEETLVHLFNHDGTESAFQADGEVITEIAFSSDGSLIAVASSDIDDVDGWILAARVQIFNVSTHAEIAHITSTTGAITKITFGPSDQHLLTLGYRSGYGHADLFYWDITTSAQLWSYDSHLWKKQNDYNDPLLLLDAAMHGSKVAAWGLYGYMNDYNYYGGAVHIWNAERQERQLEIIVKSRNSPDDLYSMYKVTFNADGSVLAVSTDDGTIGFWDVTDGSKLAEIDAQSSSLKGGTFSPDGQFLAIIADNEVRIWNIAQLGICSTCE